MGSRVAFPLRFLTDDGIHVMNVVSSQAPHALHRLGGILAREHHLRRQWLAVQRHNNAQADLPPSCSCSIPLFQSLLQGIGMVKQSRASVFHSKRKPVWVSRRKVVRSTRSCSLEQSHQLPSDADLTQGGAFSRKPHENNQESKHARRIWIG